MHGHVRARMDEFSAKFVSPRIVRVVYERTRMSADSRRGFLRLSARIIELAANILPPCRLFVRLHRWNMHSPWYQPGEKSLSTAMLERRAAPWPLHYRSAPKIWALISAVERLTRLEKFSNILRARICRNDNLQGRNTWTDSSQSVLGSMLEIVCKNYATFQRDLVDSSNRCFKCFHSSPIREGITIEGKPDESLCIRNLASGDAATLTLTEGSAIPRERVTPFEMRRSPARYHFATGMLN